MLHAHAKRNAIYADIRVVHEIQPTFLIYCFGSATRPLDSALRVRENEVHSYPTAGYDKEILIEEYLTSLLFKL